MNTIVEHINSAGHIFVEFALPMLVQCSVLIVILLLVDLVLRKKVKAVFRYCIWMLVLVKLILPTSLSSPLSLGYWFGDHLAYVAESRTSAETEAAAEAVEPALADMLPIIEPVPIDVDRHTLAVLPTMPDVESTAAEPAGPLMTPVTWQGVVFLAWLAVVMAMGLLLLQRAIFVRGLVAQAKEANDLMNDALEYCCRCMGVKRKVGLKVSANAASPAVCGLFRPVILLPHKLAPSLGSRDLRAVLMHELAHIKRGDLWVNLVQTVLQIIYFYNPLLWLANCVIRRVREQAIDEMVLVAMGEKAQQYPQTLVNVAKLAFKRPVLSLRLIGVVESKSALAGRIKHILNRPIPKTAKLGILGLLAVIVVGCVLLPMAKAERRVGQKTDVRVEVETASTSGASSGPDVAQPGQTGNLSVRVVGEGIKAHWGVIAYPAGEIRDHKNLIDSSWVGLNHCEFKGMKEGEYVVIAPVPFSVGTRGRATVQLNGWARATVEAGKDTHLQIEFQGNAGIRGDFRCPDKDLSRRIILLDGPDKSCGSSSAEIGQARALGWKIEKSGSYEIKYLSPGTYTLIARVCERDQNWIPVMEKTRTVTVGEGEITVVDFDFPSEPRRAKASVQVERKLSRSGDVTAHRGRILGVVVSSVTGEPIAGAYVGVGDFGDSGGSNYSRHRAQGFHNKTKTDEKGRFELDGLVFTDEHPYLKYHPLVVTHPDFIRHDEKVELVSSGPVPDVKVSLRPAANINVTIVDSDGNPVRGHWLLRLEALDGRCFIPPGSDPHLSSFASSIWAHWPDLRKKMGLSQGFTFTELDTGEYLLEAIRLHLVDKPTPQKIWESSITYHGAIAKLKVEAGRTKQVQIKPANHQTAVTLKMPESPEIFSGKQEIPRLLTISRKLGLMLWDTNKVYGLEDPRLGRLQKNAFFYTSARDEDVFTIKNLPPGSYCVYAGPVICMSAAKVDVVRGRQTTIQIPKVEFDGTAASVGVWTLDRKVKLQAKRYSVKELIELLTAITESNPRFTADSSIENEKLRFGKGEMSIWDVLEKLYLEKGWRVDEGEEKTLILRPGVKTDVPVDVEVETALGWLKLIDDGDYAKSFDKMAALFRGAVRKADWEKTMDLYGKGFGKAVSRKVESKRHTRYLPTGPAGEYVIIEFESSFEHKSKVTETVTLMRDRDGVWRVTNYFIK